MKNWLIAFFVALMVSIAAAGLAWLAYCFPWLILVVWFVIGFAVLVYWIKDTLE